MPHNHVLRVVLVLALFGGAAEAISSSIPYTGAGVIGTPGIDCYDEATIKANTGLQDVKDCLLACKRLKDTVTAQLARNCNKTASDVYHLMQMVDGSVTETDKHHLGDLLHKLVHDKESSCLHDIEPHLQNREKMCTFSSTQATSNTLQTTNPTLWEQEKMQVIQSARRRFALDFMHAHLTQAKQKEVSNLLHEDVYCFPVALEINRNPAAVAFFKPGSACKDILTNKWKKMDCSAACWAEIKAATTASMAMGGAPCCLSKYYQSMLDFTYGQNFPLGTNFFETVGTECNKNDLPCTNPSDAINICINDNPGPDQDKYKVELCASASSLTKSFLVIAAGVLSAASLIFWR